MPSDWPEHLNDDQAKQQLTFKVDRFDQLASDALSIFSIQMLIFPVYIAATALLVNIRDISVPDITIQTIITVVSDDFKGKLTVVHIFGWSVITTCLILSLRAYYKSRKIAYRLPNVYHNSVTPSTIERALPDDSSGAFGFKMAEKQYVKTNNFIDKYSYDPSISEIAYRRFDRINSLERELRTSLAVSLLFTPISILLILGSYLPSQLVDIIIIVSKIIIILAIIFVIASYYKIWESLEYLVEWIKSLIKAVIIATISHIVTGISVIIWEPLKSVYCRLRKTGQEAEDDEYGVGEEDEVESSEGDDEGQKD